MNYQKIYDKLIEKRKLNVPTEYFEKHHIKPRSLFPQLKKDKTNIVKLTYREHYVAHWLLTKIYPNQPKMIFAFWRMNCCQNDLYFNSNAYSTIRQKTINNMSKLRKGKYIGSSNPHFGKHHTEKAKKLISLARTGQHVSQETKKKIQQTLGKKVLCVQTNKVYNSTRAIENELKIHHAYISECCRYKKESAGRLSLEIYLIFCKY